MNRAVLPPGLDRWHPVKVVLSAAVLAALVLGVPVLLAAVGGVPFFHDGLARMQRFTTARSADPQVATRWIATVALMLAWSVWAWMALCVGIELRSWITGRPPARLPASRTAQSVAAFLVGSTLAVSAIGRVVTVPHRGVVPSSSGYTTFGPSDRAPAGVIPISDLLAGVEGPESGAGYSVRQSVDVPVLSAIAPPGQVDRESASPPPAPTPPTGPDPAPRSGSERGTGPPERSVWRAVPVSTRATVDPLAVPRTHLVCSRETLWSVAEAELGTALRWLELAQLNYGITQPDGRALDEGHWISPGWRLLLPPECPTSEPAAPSNTSLPWGPGLQPDPSSSALTVDGARSGRPGGVARLTTPRTSLVASGLRIESALEAQGHVESGAASVPAAAPDPARSPSLPVVPLGAGVVGAGVIRLLDRMREVQKRYRTEGGLIKLPDRAGRQFERRLRIGDGWALTGEVDAAIRIGARSDGGPQAEPVPLLGVRVHPEVIELVPCSGGGRASLVDRATLISSAADPDATRPLEEPSPANPRAVAPLLVTVGRSPSGPVMVNLEALGSLVVSGNSDAADAVVRALALELATSFWSGQFSLVVVGFGSELERFDGVRYYPGVSALVHTLCRRRVTAAAQLEAAGHSSFAQARQAEVSDRWSPLVVICGPTVVEAEVDELLDVAADPALGMAVVAVGERRQAEYSVRIDGGAGGAGVGPLDALADMVVPQRIESEELEELTALLDTAASRQSALTSDEPYVNVPIRLPRTVGPEIDLAADPTSDPVSPLAHAPGPGRPQPVEVAVLGPVEVRGAERPFTRAWAEELVVYLAMHPNGASNDAWATALWPDRLMAPSSLHSVASVARRSLGQAADGTDFLPRSHGRLALAPAVRTDWDRFVALADSNSTEQWHDALTLIRGRPFEGLRSSDWPILEGIAPAMEAAIVDLSGRLAGAYLKLGDARGAEWAARRGLVASPYDERLYRMLMRASDLGGNPAGVDAVMNELLTLVADGIEPLDAVHPSTMELYRQLSRRKKFGAPLSP